VWSSAWRCDLHGDVHPLHPVFRPSAEGRDGLLRTGGVPVWLPWPLPASWLVTGFATTPPVAAVSFGNHDFPLWPVDSPDRAVFAGEIKAHWLWVVLWPETAGTLLIEPIALRDLRDPGQDLDLPFGAASVRLPAS
jgi:hypothetical protein